jgi:hypothetical protein
MECYVNTAQPMYHVGILYGKPYNGRTPLL